MPSRVASYSDNDLIGTQASTADANFDQTHPLYRDIAEKSRLLKQHPGLRHGKQVVHFSSDEPGLFVFSRINKTQHYWILVNTSKTEKEYTLPMSAEGYQIIYPSAEIKKASGRIAVPPLGAKVISLGEYP